MKVKIVRGSGWYMHKEGNEYEVFDSPAHYGTDIIPDRNIDEHWYILKIREPYQERKRILKLDCEVVKQVVKQTVATMLVDRKDRRIKGDPIKVFSRSKDWPVQPTDFPAYALGSTTDWYRCYDQQDSLLSKKYYGPFGQPLTGEEIDIIASKKQASEKEKEYGIEFLRFPLFNTEKGKTDDSRFLRFANNVYFEVRDKILYFTSKEGSNHASVSVFYPDQALLIAKFINLHFTNVKTVGSFPLFTTKSMLEKFLERKIARTPGGTQTGSFQSGEATPNDPVNRPAHYADGKIEVIDFIEDKKLNFRNGNAVKYIARAGKKDPSKYLEDLKKAQWYLNREIAQTEALQKS